MSRFALHENRFENVKMAETLGFFLFSRRSVKIDFSTTVKMMGFCHFQMCMIFTPYGGQPSLQAAAGLPGVWPLNEIGRARKRGADDFEPCADH